MKNYILDDWEDINEEEMMQNQNFANNDQQNYQPAQNQDPNQIQGQYGNQDQNLNQNQDQDNNFDQDQDVSKDPMIPDMPEDNIGNEDFEKWKNEYFKKTTKYNSEELINLLSKYRDNENLLSVQKKFVEDNFNIQLIRQNSNIDKASRDIRKYIFDKIDKNNPSSTLISSVFNTLQNIPTLSNIFVKLKGYSGIKGDLHRKYIAALLCAVQVGSGSSSEDIIYNDRDYSIYISTRLNSEFGDINLGMWNLKEDDPERHLTDPELKRLKDGSPEERDILRKRIILESISKQFEKRSFFINVVDNDGTVYFIGVDLASALRSAYADGNIIIKTSIADNSECFISDSGEIVPYMDLEILYCKKTGEMDENGLPEVKEFNFISRREGMLFLNAELKTIKTSSDSMQGIIFKEFPYNGNPSDLKILSRCVYSTADLILRNC